MSEHESGHHDHPAHLEHHFETSEQQFESSKLGMWVFLATEILMFGGLFAAYAVYRANHEDVFMYAHHFLSVKWGAINTVILLASSFTIAWGVRAAQLGQRQLLVTMLGLTLLGGAGFMVIKTIEYYEKYDEDYHGITWVGPTNIFYPGEALLEFDRQQRGEAAEPEEEQARAWPGEQRFVTPLAIDTEPNENEAAPPPAGFDGWSHPRVGDGPEGLDWDALEADRPRLARAGIFEHEFPEWDDLTPMEKKRTHIFFQIYFLMTGLHGLHVLIGMGLIAWVMIKSWAGAFTPAYYTPVDLVGLYWHLVDLIWIFLFPLLYLIH